MDTPVQATFPGIWLPMVTPMRGGYVDCEAAQALARYYRNAGIAGLVLFGSTGEGNLLSIPEKIEMIEAIRRDPHALPLVFGAGGVDTRGVAAAIRRLDKYAPAGYLVPPPYYLGPSQQGILWHYRQIAWATERPIILYNIPKRAGVSMTVETMESLALLPNLRAVKECNPAALMALNARGHAAGARRPRRGRARAVRAAARPGPPAVRRTQPGADQTGFGAAGPDRRRTAPAHDQRQPRTDATPATRDERGAGVA